MANQYRLQFCLQFRLQFHFLNKICKQKNTTVRDKCPPSVPQMSPKVSLNNTFYTDMTNI